MARKAFIPDYTVTDPARHDVLPSGRRADVRSAQEREDQIVEYVGSFMQEHGYSPSIREIAHGLGLLSLSTVRTYLVQLILEGRLEDTGAPTRYIRTPQ